MNTLFKNILFIVIILFSSLFITGCEEPEETFSYSFEVISTGKGFFGYYKIDGGATVDFVSSPMGTTGNYFSFEKGLSSPKSLVVSATGNETLTSSITIYIYANYDPVASSTVVQNGSSAPTVTISHTFDSEE